MDTNNTNNYDFENMTTDDLISYISKRSDRRGNCHKNHNYSLTDFMKRYDIQGLRLAKKKDLIEYVTEMQNEDWSDTYNHFERNI